HAFPRSVRYCVQSVEHAISVISGSPPGVYNTNAERYCDQLRSQLSCAQSADVLDVGLHEFVDALQGKLNDIGGAIAESFFGAVPVVAPCPPDAVDLSPTQMQTQNSG